MPFPNVLIRQPFLLITSAFSLGIVMMSFIPAYFGPLFLLFFLSSLSFSIFFLKNKWIQFGLLFVGFLTLGFLATTEKQKSRTGTDFQDVYLLGNLVEAEILDVSRSEKIWNKAILRIQYVHQLESKIPVDEKVLFLVQTDSNSLSKGDVLLLNSEIENIKNKGNPGEFDAVQFWKAKGISRMAFLQTGQFQILRNTQHLLERWFNELDAMLSTLFEKIVHPDAVGIAKALVLGDRDHLDSESVRAFGNTGAMHVLAVSGLHIGLILNMLMYFFGLFPTVMSKRGATLWALALIWFYALLTGFSPSVIRAVVMFSMLTYAKLSGRNHHPLNVLFASALLILLYDPLILYDLGFQLSYLAMLGIFLIYKPILGLFYVKNKWMKIVWEGTAVSLSAQVFTLPLTLYCFHQFPNYFLIANLGMMVFSNIILLIGVLLIVFHFIPGINTILAWSLSFLVIAMFYFVQWVDSIPGSTAGGFEFTSFQIVLFYLAIVAVLLSIKFKKEWRIFSLISIVCMCIVIVVNRFNSIEKNELIVFNDSKLIVCLKMNEEIHCFYEYEDQLPRAQFVAESYAKLRSGKVVFCQMKPNEKINLYNSHLNFSCQNARNECKLEVNDKQFTIIKNINFENSKEQQTKAIYMPWLDVSEVAGHALREGAFVLPINSTPSTKPRSKATV